MARHVLTLDSLQRLDRGKLVAALDLEMRRAVQDCLDRPGDTRPREARLVFKLIPLAPQDGSPSRDEVAVEGRAFSKIPERRSKVYVMAAQEDGGLVFNEDSAENDDTLMDEMPDPPAKAKA